MLNTFCVRENIEPKLKFVYSMCGGDERTFENLLSFKMEKKMRLMVNCVERNDVTALYWKYVKTQDKCVYFQ